MERKRQVNKELDLQTGVEVVRITPCRVQLTAPDTLEDNDDEHIDMSPGRIQITATSSLECCVTGDTEEAKGKRIVLPTCFQKWLDNHAGEYKGMSIGLKLGVVSGVNPLGYRWVLEVERMMA